MKTLIKGGVIVTDGHSFVGSVVINDDIIENILEGIIEPRGTYDKVIEASGCFVLPGVIDEHVHFREPGLERKADIESESRAAALGGVTSYFEMPNTNPQTTTIEALNDKFALAKQKSHVNYSFFFGATNDNQEEFAKLDCHRVPGIKLFMGSSTGNMLVDHREVLERIFEKAQMPIMTHCEDTDIINCNMSKAKTQWGEDPSVEHHPWIRSEKACYESTKLAVSLARKYNARLHVAHVSTAKELEFFGHDSNITGEAVIAHLLYSDADYNTLGTRIKCNPAIKTLNDRDELRKALSDGRITTVGTDHAPHEWADKQGGCAKAASGMPMVQFSLPAMLELVDNGILTIERMVELMCHAPARLFEVNKRGFIQKGYKADIVVVKPDTPWTVDKDIIQSKCKWSPLEGHTFNWKVIHTICNGHVVLDNGLFDSDYRGEELTFR
jgi:dihydroorotase